MKTCHLEDQIKGNANDKLVPLPKDKLVIGTKNKLDENDKVVKNKTTLVAQARLEVILLSFVAHNDRKLYQMNIKLFS
ncbi:hypothetical protein CR513_16397, partial [Mucuna pruriens]